MKKAAVWAMTVLLITSFNAAAVFETGNTVYSDCETDLMAAEGYCIGVIVGTADGLDLHKCLPNTVTKGQLRDVVVLWLRNNPDQRHQPIADIVRAALKKSFGCPP